MTMEQNQREAVLLALKMEEKGPWVKEVSRL